MLAAGHFGILSKTAFVFEGHKQTVGQFFFEVLGFSLAECYIRGDDEGVIYRECFFFFCEIHIAHQ